MTRLSIFLPSTLCILVTLAGCSKSTNKAANEPTASPSDAVETKHIASVDVVKAAAQPVDVQAGSSAGAKVHLTIQNGYHINANPPTYSYLKATALEILPTEGVSAGPVTYPKALERKFPFAEKPLAVYEGETELKATLKADKAAKTGQRSISARLRIQACDDQVCYPPGTLDLAIPVNIK